MFEAQPLTTASYSFHYAHKNSNDYIVGVIIEIYIVTPFKIMNAEVDL